MKKIILALAFGVTAFFTHAQVSVTPISQLMISTSLVNEYSTALRVRVPSNLTHGIAYTLTKGLDPATSTDVFYVSSAGWLWAEQGGWFGSDMKLKKNVSKVPNAMTKINQLNGIEFDYIQKDSLGREKTTQDSSIHGKRIGVSAQDVEKVFPGLVRDMPNGTKAVSYTDLIGVLIEGMKEQQVQIESLRYQLGKQNGKANAREVLEDELLASYLVQNYPNPFTASTSVRYNVASTAKTASIMIFDMAGTLLRTYDNIQKGDATITIEAGELNAGMYMYSLIVDGVELDSKRMILTK
jgi:hypothetical protein